MSKRSKCLIIGACAGAANGFFGSGGGLFLVPLLTGWLALEPKRAFATSVAVIFPLSACSAAVYFFHGNVSFSYALPYLLGGAIGGLTAGLLFHKVSARWLRRLFGILLIWGGLRTVMGW